jgi:hypothetical protein
MKKTIVKSHSVKSVSADSLRNVLTLMGENLVAWRKSPAVSPTGERERCLDKCLVTGREAYRLMAIKLLIGRRGKLDVIDAEEDIAQECSLKLIERAHSGRFPFDMAQIDALLVDAKSKRKPLTGNGSPMNALLHEVFRCGANDQVRSIETKQQRLVLGYEENDMFDDNHEHLVCQCSILRQGGAMRQRQGRSDDGLWVFNDDKVLRDVIKRSRIGQAVAIHDAYLDAETYRGQPLRKALGSWTPMREWLEHCDTKDRPKKGISKETLQRHIKTIKGLIRSSKSKAGGFPSAPKGASL